MNLRLLALSAALVPGILASIPVWAETSFRVAAYNVENYLDQSSESRQVKSSAARAKIRESILAIRPDVLALEEMGSTNALLELRDSLNRAGLDLPYWEHVAGWDTNIYVAILSRFPFTARRSHTNESYLLSGRRFHVSRGFGEVDIQVTTNYSFTLIAAHLKSKRTVIMADEAEMRLEEARLLREKVDARLAADPKANVVVLGDFNDTKDSPSTKAVIGRGRNKLIDTRPAERNGDTPTPPVGDREPAVITWTHYFAKEDSYSRIDYLLLSPDMAREWITNETYIPTIPNWGVGSDHRPVTAAFSTTDK